MMETCLNCLSHQGRLVEISAPAKESRVCFNLRDFYHREARLLGTDSRASTVTDCAVILKELTSGFESAAVRVLSADITTYRLSEAIKAYEKILNKTVRGKVILTPD